MRDDLRELARRLERVEITAESLPVTVGDSVAAPSPHQVLGGTLAAEASSGSPTILITPAPLYDGIDGPVLALNARPTENRSPGEQVFAARGTTPQDVFGVDVEWEELSPASDGGDSQPREPLARAAVLENYTTDDREVLVDSTDFEVFLNDNGFEPSGTEGQNSDGSFVIDGGTPTDGPSDGLRVSNPSITGFDGFEGDTVLLVSDSSGGILDWTPNTTIAQGSLRVAVEPQAGPDQGERFVWRHEIPPISATLPAEDNRVTGDEFNEEERAFWVRVRPADPVEWRIVANIPSGGTPFAGNVTQDVPAADNANGSVEVDVWVTHFSGRLLSPARQMQANWYSRSTRSLTASSGRALRCAGVTNGEGSLDLHVIDCESDEFDFTPPS